MDGLSSGCRWQVWDWTGPADVRAYDGPRLTAPAPARAGPCQSGRLRCSFPSRVRLRQGVGVVRIGFVDGGSLAGNEFSIV